MNCKEMNILKLEPGDIIDHELYGELTILERDDKHERYLVGFDFNDKMLEIHWIGFFAVKQVCEIKNQFNGDIECM